MASAAASITGIRTTVSQPLKRTEKVNPAAIRKVAESASFQSREPIPAEPPVSKGSEPRTYRTNRNVQFSVKVTQDLHDEIYVVTDDLAKRMEAQVPGMRWTVGMTFERRAHLFFLGQPLPAPAVGYFVHSDSFRYFSSSAGK